LPQTITDLFYIWRMKRAEEATPVSLGAPPSAISCIEDTDTLFLNGGATNERICSKVSKRGFA
jgi:hypothetical protein